LWFFESECDEPSRRLVQQKFAEGHFVQDQGAIGIDLSPYKLGFAMFLKSDGNGLYITKDLELLRRKFADPAVTSSIVVVDQRQKLHFQQLYKTAELIGYPQATKSSTLLYETVNTADGKPFSSRSMNGLRLLELRVAMENKVTQDYLERYRGTWSDADIAETAKQVTIGALKYGMLRVDNSTQVTFVLDEWLKLDGDTGPYLQYMHARCCNIIEKQGSPIAGGNICFEAAEERALLFHLSRFNEFAHQSAAHQRPSVVAGYLYDLAKAFNRFYEACPIRSSEGDLRNSRLCLVQASAKVMKEGLALLGIPAPSRM
ncbi:arginine--tRNA ligase, partial [bacterium]|nr:arginine--tRNA ligase [bacterium]